MILDIAINISTEFLIYFGLVCAGVVVGAALLLALIAWVMRDFKILP